MVQVNSSNKTYPLVGAENADALVIHCSDPRFQSAFRQFVTDELGIANPVPIIIPGGIHDLISPARIKAARQLWQHLEFTVTRMKVRRIVMINHEDCLWYAKWNTLVGTKVNEDIAGHLAAAAEKLIEKRFNVTIESYIARIKDGEIVFESLEK